MEIHKKEPVIPEGYESLLRSNAVANIATIGPHGEPQNSPVWFDWDGQYLKFSQTKARQKYRNLARDPRIAVSIVDLQNPYRYLEVRGVVEKIEEDSNLDFTNALAKKYLGVDEYPYHRPGDERVVLFVRPDRAIGMA